MCWCVKVNVNAYVHLFLKFHKSCSYTGAWVAHEHVEREGSLSCGSLHCFILCVCCKTCCPARVAPGQVQAEWPPVYSCARFSWSSETMGVQPALAWPYLGRQMRWDGSRAAQCCHHHWESGTFSQEVALPGCREWEGKDPCATSAEKANGAGAATPTWTHGGLNEQELWTVWVLVNIRNLFLVNTYKIGVLSYAG